MSPATTHPWRSTSLRLAIGYACLFVASSLILVGFVWWSTARYLDREIDSVILTEANALADRWAEDGLAGVAAAIGDRIDEPADERAIYLLVDGGLRRIAGNLDAWPLQVGRRPGWYQAELVRGQETRAVRFFHIVVRSGHHLLVGRDVQERRRIQGSVLEALLAGTGAIAGLAIAGGLVFRRIVLGRVEAIRRTTEAIVHGELSRRVPGLGSGDEFDLLTDTVNGMLGQIEALMAGMRNMSNAVAHDLRTPLAELRGRLETLLANPPAPDELPGELEAAIADVDRLIAIFNALLRIAEVDSGARRAGFAPVDLAAVARETAELYGALAAARRQAFEVTAAAPAVVLGDRQLLAQAVANLLDNAIKYTPVGGRIALSVVPADGRHRLTVADSGPGIPPEDRERVTERFFRGDASRSTPGVGLGLSLVGAVVKLHDGTLVLTGEGPGLRAAIELPAGAAGTA